MLDFIDSLNLQSKGKKIIPYDDQFNAVYLCIKNNRKLILSSTSSGKSLISYILTRWFQTHNEEGKLCVIVPTITLVNQLFSDWADYSSLDTWSVYDNVHMLYGGQSKSFREQVLISTWQSLITCDKNFFKQFNGFIIDEAHGASAPSLRKISGYCVNASFRCGMTGTLDGTEVHQLLVEGSTGEMTTIVKTHELIEKKRASPLIIRGIILTHSEEERKKLYKANYKDEIDYVISCDKRTKYIVNLVGSREKNSIVLFSRIEQGKTLYEMTKEKYPDRPVFFVSGITEVEEREQIRYLMGHYNNAILYASFGTFSVGTNIPNLYNLFLASPSKGKIRILQSIGRGIRLHDEGKVLNVWDITDNLCYDDHTNYGIKHYIQRRKIYKNEKFEIKTYSVDL